MIKENMLEQSEKDLSNDPIPTPIEQDASKDIPQPSVEVRKCGLLILNLCV